MMNNNPAEIQTQNDYQKALTKPSGVKLEGG
jgi:hypothetical protein